MFLPWWWSPWWMRQWWLWSSWWTWWLWKGWEVGRVYFAEWRLWGCQQLILQLCWLFYQYELQSKYKLHSKYKLQSKHIKYGFVLFVCLSKSVVPESQRGRLLSYIRPVRCTWNCMVEHYAYCGILVIMENVYFYRRFPCVQCFGKLQKSWW